MGRGLLHGAFRHFSTKVMPRKVTAEDYEARIRRKQNVVDRAQKAHRAVQRRNQKLREKLNDAADVLQREKEKHREKLQESENKLLEVKAKHREKQQASENQLQELKEKHRERIKANELEFQEKLKEIKHLKLLANMRACALAVVDKQGFYEKHEKMWLEQFLDGEWDPEDLLKYFKKEHLLIR
jgi:flagellar biosynthesis GTPase FlhF